MTKCSSLKRGKWFDTCLKTNKTMAPRDTTMCRKNPENCKENKKDTSLGDFC